MISSSNIGHLLTWGVHLSVSSLFPFSYCWWCSQGKNTEVVCHSLLQWTTFGQNSPPWPIGLGCPYMAWLCFIELNKAVVHVIRLASCLWLWFQSVCPLMPSLSAYRLNWVSLTLDVRYLFTLLQQSTATAPYLGRVVSPLGCSCTMQLLPMHCAAASPALHSHPSFLGINLPKETKELYTENYKTLMKEIKDHINRWRDIPYS